MAEGESSILTRVEERSKEIILFSKSGKGSVETQRVRRGRGGSILTDILTVQKATGIRNPGKTHNSTRNSAATQTAESLDLFAPNYEMCMWGKKATFNKQRFSPLLWCLPITTANTKSLQNNIKVHL